MKIFDRHWAKRLRNALRRPDGRLPAGGLRIRPLATGPIIVRPSNPSAGCVHFLHIPKTGGTALRAALVQKNSACATTFHDHLIRLADIPSGEKIIFGIRDPVSRFVSGYNFRMSTRAGPPIMDELRRMPTANSAAEALSSLDGRDRLGAMKLIRHTFSTSTPLSFWLGSKEYLRAREKDILYICLQERLNEDFQRLKDLLGIAQDIQLPEDPVAANRTAADLDRDVSALGRENLRDWFGGDFALFDAALEMRDRIRNRPGGGQAAP